MELVKTVGTPGTRKGAATKRSIHVNVIMRKRDWLVRVSLPDQNPAVFFIPPSLAALREQLEQNYPGQKCRIDYLGIFQVF